MKKEENKFYISTKAEDEIEHVTGKKPPIFKDVETMETDQYMNGIKKKNALLICMPIPTPGFPDNLQGECSDCGCDIYYRPYLEKASKKVCIRCGLKIIEEEEKHGSDKKV